jgi:DNA repair exonuclease SbcCD ATPase subunit
MKEQGLDDMLDARREIRRLKKEVAAKRAEFNEARSQLAAANDRLEKVLVEIEQKQGVMDFGEDDAEASAKPKRAKGISAAASA